MHTISGASRFFFSPRMGRASFFSSLCSICHAYHMLLSLSSLSPFLCFLSPVLASLSPSLPRLNKSSHSASVSQIKGSFVPLLSVRPFVTLIPFLSFLSLFSLQLPLSFLLFPCWLCFLVSRSLVTFILVVGFLLALRRRIASPQPPTPPSRLLCFLACPSSQCGDSEAAVRVSSFISRNLDTTNPSAVPTIKVSHKGTNKQRKKERLREVRAVQFLSFILLASRPGFLLN